jgi:hypothetical protein
MSQDTTILTLVQYCERFVSDDARPNSSVADEGKPSDVVEIVKLNGEFRKWGPFWGPLLYWLSIKAARSRSILRPGWFVAVASIVLTAWKFWP